MAKYRVLETSFIADKLVEPFDAKGRPTIIEFDGEPGKNLELVSNVRSRGVEAHGTAIDYDTDVSDLA